MKLKERYEKAKKRLLADEAICKVNRELFRGFFEFEEWKPGSFSIVKGSSETYDDIKSSTKNHLQDYYNEPGFKGD